MPKKELVRIRQTGNGFSKVQYSDARHSTMETDKYTCLDPSLFKKNAFGREMN